MVYDDMLKDHGYPTGGSKNFGSAEMKKNQDMTAIWKKQCYNCKKFKYSESGN